MKKKTNSLRVHTQPRPIRLHELPQNELRRLIDVVPARVLGKVAVEGHLGQLDLEHVRLIEEQDDRSPQEPPRVDDRLEESQRLGHAVLRDMSVIIA